MFCESPMKIGEDDFISFSLGFKFRHSVHCHGEEKVLFFLVPRFSSYLPFRDIDFTPHDKLRPHFSRDSPKTVVFNFHCLPAGWKDVFQNVLKILFPCSFNQEGLIEAAD